MAGVGEEFGLSIGKCGREESEEHSPVRKASHAGCNEADSLGGSGRLLERRGDVHGQRGREIRRH